MKMKTSLRLNDITDKNEVKKTILFIENEIGQIDIALLNAAAILQIESRI